MTFQTWGAAAIVVAASLLLGQAVNLGGIRCRAAAPAVGLALLIILASVAIKLPGDASTAAVILAVTVIAAALLVVARRRAWRLSVFPLTVIGVSAFGAAIPFIANGRVGLLGVSLDNDTATHLSYAEGLRSAISRSLFGVPPGYPLGPHTLADALSSGLGVRLDLAFTALQIATVVITALVAANALRNERWFKRLAVGTLGALLYLVAAYYAEGSFKEPIVGLFLLAIVLHLEEVTRNWSAQPGQRARALIPVAVLVAATVYVYSYLGVAWPALTVAIWLVLEVPGNLNSIRRARVLARGLLVSGAVSLAVLLALLTPIAGRILSLVTTFGVSPSGTGAITTSNVGNLGTALSPYEALGIWNNPDFRFFPANLFPAGELAALALAVLVLGMVWSFARRELILPAAVLACAVIYWRSSHGQSIYVTAKSLAIAGPVVAVCGLRGLLAAPRRSLGPRLAMARFLLAVVFVVFALHSTYLALTNEPVWPQESTSELLALDKLTRGQTLMFLGASDYADWIFHDSEMSALAPDSISLGRAGPRPSKLNTYATALDFDSINPVNIGQFPWVITTNTPYASQSPSGFRLVRRLPMYEAWQRIGPVAPRQALDPAGAPGAILNCRTPAGRTLSHSSGVAAVMTPPVVKPLAATGPGGVIATPLSLPAGRWTLSLQYTSAVDLEVSAEGHRWTMPAYLDRPGPVFAVGDMSSVGRPVALVIRAAKPSGLTGPNLIAQVTAVIATRSPDTRILVPLRRSCGRYIDWYRT